jgi:hypothetical protein
MIFKKNKTDKHTYKYCAIHLSGTTNIWNNENMGFVSFHFFSHVREFVLKKDLSDSDN